MLEIQHRLLIEKGDDCGLAPNSIVEDEVKMGESEMNLDGVAEENIQSSKRGRTTFQRA
jgi:hypothetical protein